MGESQICPIIFGQIFDKVFGLIIRPKQCSVQHYKLIPIPSGSQCDLCICETLSYRLPPEMNRVSALLQSWGDYDFMREGRGSCYHSGKLSSILGGVGGSMCRVGEAQNATMRYNTNEYREIMDIIIPEEENWGSPPRPRGRSPRGRGGLPKFSPEGWLFTRSSRWAWCYNILS